MKKALEDAKKQQPSRARRLAGQVEYEWTVDLKETGKTEKISEWTPGRS